MDSSSTQAINIHKRTGAHSLTITTTYAVNYIRIFYDFLANKTYFVWNGTRM